MIDQDDANIFVAVDLHDCFFEGWGAEKPPHIITEPIGLNGYTQGILIKLAIPVLVMEQDNRVLSRIEIGEEVALDVSKRGRETIMSPVG